MNKAKLHIFGWITLLVFPLPAFLWLHYAEGRSLSDFLRPDQVLSIGTGLGIELGVAYAFFILLMMRAPVFEKLPARVERIIAAMKLNLADAVFLSLCAGIGEELLFRAGIQFYLGPWITSVVFVAIHGYLNPMNWRMSLYGLLLLPFIFLISFGYYTFGLWFSIGAHFAYDLVLFLSIREE